MRLFLCALALGLVACGGGDEATSGSDNEEHTATQCQDGADNDGDGATDCADLDCQGYTFCSDAGSDADTDTDSDTDTDGDGGVDTDIDTETECLEGSFTITNSLDVDLLYPYPCVTGDLKLNASGLTAVVLPNLVWVGGTLDFGTNIESTTLDLSTVDLGSLVEVGESLNISTPDIESLDLSALSTVGGEFFLIATEMTDPLDLGNLESVAGDQINLSGGYSALDLGSLVTFDGEIRIIWSTIEDLDGVSSLTTLGGDLFVVNNASLPSCEVCGLLNQLGGYTGETTAYGNLEDSCWVDGGLSCP